VPEKILTNKDLEGMVATNDAWIFERTGIRSRHIAAEGESTSDMATQAAMRAIEFAGVQVEDIDLIVMGTISGDVKMPACAAYVQAKLGAHRATAFDVSAACAGSIYALSIAEKFIRTGSAKLALVIGAEMLSRITDWTDRNTCVLFGDAAGAFLLAAPDSPDAETRDRGILSTHLHTDGTQTDILDIHGGGSLRPISSEVVEARSQFIHMSGREVFKHAVRRLEEVSREALDANGLQPSDVDHVIAHQANIRILEAVLKRLDIPMDKAVTNIERLGNTSSASLPMTLDEANRGGQLQEGQLLLMMAIGAGLAWGGAVVRW